MTSMNIEMRLGLIDTASAPVKAFTATLEALEAAVAGVSGKMAGFSAGMEAMGASLGLVKSNSAGVAAELGAIGSGAGTAAAETARLEASMAALGASLQGMVGKLAGVAAGMAEVGAASRTIGSGSASAMSAIGTGAQNANEHVNTLASSIKGMAELWAAFKIEKGLKTSVVEAAEYERTDNRLKNLKLTPEDSDMVHKAVRSTGQAFPQFDQNQLLEMAIDLRNATGSAHEAATGLKGFAESVFAINLSMPSGKKLDQQGQLNFAKFLEGRGVTMDPAAMEAQQDLVAKITAATQGRVNPNNLFGNLSYAKGGLGQTMDDDALKTFAAMIEQDTIGGGTGGRVGTMLTSFVNSITKANAITTKNRDEWMKLGLVDPGKVNVNENTNRVTSIQAGAIAGTEIVGKNFKKWVDDYLRPALISAGVDMNDITAVKAKTDVLFPNRNASEAAFELLARKPLIEKDVANIDQAAGKNEQVANGTKLAEAQFQKFTVAVKDLGIAIGTTLLPVITPLISGLASIIQSIAGFTTAHPIFGFLLAMTAGFGSISLVIAGATRLFGPIAGLLLGTGEAATGLAGAFTVVGGAIGVAVGVIMRWLLRLVPVVGLILLAWDAGLGEWISKLNVFGHSVGDWANSLANDVVTAFKNMWVRTREFFGYLSADAAKAQIEANNTARNDKQRALGFGSQEISGKIKQRSGASGDWGRDEAVTLEAKATEEKIGSGKAIAAQLAANRTAAAGLGGGNGGRAGGSRFKNYDPDLDDAKNAFRLEEDDLRRHSAAEEELYKANKISIQAYYDDRLATTRKGINAQIAELEREQAAYRAQGDKAGVNRIGTDITLKKRDLADAEKSVEVQREKDLNALKEKGLALDAKVLEAEGKKKQAHMAREVDGLEKDKKAFLLNGDTDHAQRAQEAIDIAKLTGAWDQFGVDTKKIQDEAKTKEEAVSAAVKSGSMTAYQAEQQVFAIRKEEAKQLDELIAKYRALILASDAPDEVKQERLRSLNLEKAKNDSMLGEMNPEDLRAKQTMDSAVQNGFGNMFQAIITRSKTASQAFKEFGASISNTVTKLASEKLGKMLFESLFGGGGGAGGSFSGGGGMISGIAGLFGGSGSGTSAGSGSGSTDLSMAGGAAASDTSFWSTAATWLASLDVGTDRVPQDMVAMIHKDEMIIPAYDANRIRAGQSGGQAMQVHNHFAISGPVTRDTQNQLAAASGIGIQRAARRNG